MAWKKKMVYVVTAWFDDDFWGSEFDEFFVDSLDEAEKLQHELSKNPVYEDVWISDFLEEREILV